MTRVVTRVTASKNRGFLLVTMVTRVTRVVLSGDRFSPLARSRARLLLLLFSFCFNQLAGSFLRLVTTAGRLAGRDATGDLWRSGQF
jgi:hypothetical protein